jgi:hypothetical protein
MLSFAAMAELGGTVQTVQADQQRLQGTRTVIARTAYQVHEIKTATNGVVREFVSPDGKVFAVTYEGRFPGESNGLLGAYANQLAQAKQAAAGKAHVAGTIHLESGYLRYHAAGHLGYFSMRAVVSNAVPSGVTMEEIQ